MNNPLEIRLRGHVFQLYAERCVFWPDEQTLFVADMHLGKDATFGRHGIPVPAGSTESTLAIIETVLSRTGATRLCVLGDMFHARSSLSKRVQIEMNRFLEGLSDLELVLVEGNHDQHVGRLPSSWKINVVASGFRIGTVTVGHDPDDAPGDSSLYLCGHVHPAVRFGTGAESTGRLPCFWHCDGRLVLPAIGGFTGTHLIRPGGKDDIWVIAEGLVTSLYESSVTRRH